MPDALLCLGDGHAAQGDGEVGGTAIECAMTTEVVAGPDRRPAGAGDPRGHPGRRITFGFSRDLDEAMGDALEAMLTWMQVRFGVDRAAALALASPTVDLRVTQVANGVWGVHAGLPGAALTGLRSWLSAGRGARRSAGRARGRSGAAWSGYVRLHVAGRPHVSLGRRAGLAAAAGRVSRRGTGSSRAGGRSC